MKAHHPTSHLHVTGRTLSGIAKQLAKALRLSGRLRQRMASGQSERGGAMNLPQPLTKGERIAFRDFQPNESWLVVYTSECGATIERELRTPKLVEIKDDEGTVLRSFYARTSGDRQQISLRSSVIRLGVSQ